MTLYVNTIEFSGRKAVINSYSNHPLLVESRERQLSSWKARYPNAKVKTEEMSESDTAELVAVEGDRHNLAYLAYEIGQASEA